jgi:hypothetical protein
LENIETTLNLPVSIGIHFQTIIITFHPIPFLAFNMNQRRDWGNNDESESAEEKTVKNTQAQVFAAFKSIAKSNAVKQCNTEIMEIGDPRDLNNYLPDSGATQHMTPHLGDLHDTVEGQNLGVEVEVHNNGKNKC